MVKPSRSNSSGGTGATPSSSTASKRKRGEYEDPFGVVGSKKRYESPVGKARDRSQTPGTKIARFARGSNITKEATPAEPARGQSPGRPILHKPASRDDGPSAQLHGEHEASLSRGTTPQLQPSIQKPTSPRKPKSAQTKVHKTTGVIQACGDLKVGRRRSSSNKTRASKKGVQDVEVDLDSEDSMDEELAVDDGRGTQSRGLLADDDVCVKVDKLREMAIELADTCPRLQKDEKENVFKDLLIEENEQLVRHIGCLAMGGSKGEDGWKELLGDKFLRRAIALGVIGRTLKENVFSELYFGASEKLAKKLSEQETSLTHQDGFLRTQRRAAEIRGHKAKPSDEGHYLEAVAEVVVKMETLLRPLWDPASALGSRSEWDVSKNREKLVRLVYEAAQLSRAMRTTSDTVYYWPPTFKDEEFEPSRMECCNLKDMINDSPYDKKGINGFERAILREGHEGHGEAIVRIVCFPGLVAYRKGGGELARQEMDREEAERRKAEGRQQVPPDVMRRRRELASHEKPLSEHEGFRTREISKSVVWLQWGRQRLLTKEAGTSRHIDAMKKGASGLKKYTADSKDFVELHTLYQRKMDNEKPAAAQTTGLLAYIPTWRSPAPESPPKKPDGSHPTSGRKPSGSR